MTSLDETRATFPRDVTRTGPRAVRLGIETDTEGRVLRARPATVEPLGWDAPNLVGEYASDLFVADDALSVRALLWRAARGRACAPAQLRIHAADDSEIVVRVSARAAEYGISIRIRECDAAELDAYRAAAPERARFDPLTGLANRRLVLDRVRAALRTAPHALVLVDVDRFRDLATAFGSRVCDDVLVEVADRLVAAIADSGEVGLSGHQFTILVPVHALPGTIGNLVAQIRAVIGEPIATPPGTIELSACLGIAVSPVAPSSIGVSPEADSLLAEAEVALAQAKALGPGNDAMFDPAFRTRVVRHAALQSELSHAVADHELRLDFQPIVELETAAIVGYEALVRWQHPSRGLLAPCDFLETAQTSPAGAAIDGWVLIEACRATAASPRAGSAPTICVNVAPERFVAAGFVDRVERALANSGLDPARLVLEITEWSIFVDLDAARTTLAALSALGIRVALDDYGTGYASLANIATLPVDEVKIDTSFVAGLGSDRAHTAIVRAIVGLGNALDITVVAEGIETAEQAFALRALGCKYGQGFHFGRPTPIPALVSSVLTGMS